MLLVGLFPAATPVMHMRGAHYGEIAKSTGGFFFVWTLWALGIHCLMKSDALSFIPRWRTPRRVGGHEFVSHAEQVPQDAGCDAGQANQHGAVVEIVVGHVVNVGVGCEQFGAVVKADANHKRTRLSRAILRHARQEFPSNLERGRAVCRAFLHAGQRQADLPYRVEVDGASWHGCDYPQEREPFQSLLLRCASITMNSLHAHLSPRLRVYEGMTEVERHNPDQRHNSFLVKLGTRERGDDERRKRSDHEGNDGARREEAEGAPCSVSQADDEPPCKSRDYCCLYAGAIERANSGIEPQDGDSFQQIKYDIEQKETGRGLAQMVVGKSSEVAP
jgi:hypothetical protein